jgi:uncharacterized protein (TIGR03437 family)
MRLWILAVAVYCGLLNAQSSFNNQMSTGTVGIPFSFQFQAAPLSTIIGMPVPDGITYTYSFAVPPNQILPPGLTFSASGLLSGVPTQTGGYNFAVVVNYVLSSTEGTSTDPIGFLGSVEVLPNHGAMLSVAPASLTFASETGVNSTISKAVVVQNSSSADASFTVSSSTADGKPWLSVSSGNQTVKAFSDESIFVNFNPSGLAEGIYTGTVSISVGSQNFVVATIATVSSSQPRLQLSQKGLYFKTVAGGGNPPAQSLAVLADGGGLSFSVTTFTTSGGSQWLSASPASGTVTPSASSAVQVSINPAGLAAGVYYGAVKLAAQGAGSVQIATIVLTVEAKGTDLVQSVFPTGLIFVGQAGTSDPAAQTLSINNPSPSTLTYGAVPSTNSANNWLSVQPSSGSVNETLSPVQVSVQPSTAGLASGIYRGEVVFQFAQNNTAQHVAVLLILLPGAANRTGQRVESGCMPTQLLPVFTQLGDDFAAIAAWPMALEITVVDDCGNYLTSGNVTVSFSNGDPSLPLTSLNDGRWTQTWQPGHSSAQVVITADAIEAAPAIEGTASIGGTVASNPVTPTISAVVSAAKYATNQPLAPGGFISIYGSNLSAGPNLAGSLPLNTQLGQTQAVVGGQAMPLQFAGTGQINAIIPFDLAANSTQELIVLNGPAISVPQTVVIGPAQPAIFAQSDGLGVVFDVQPGTTAQVLMDAGHPLSAGDAIVIYCAGLGPVNPAVAAGAAAPGSPAATTVNPVTVTVGGQTAKVFFSGLVGGFAGLYQVNAYVPGGVTPGDSVPLVISAAGFDSAPVNVVVK